MISSVLIDQLLPSGMQRVYRSAVMLTRKLGFTDVVSFIVNDPSTTWLGSNNLDLSIGDMDGLDVTSVFKK